MKRSAKLFIIMLLALAVSACSNDDQGREKTGRSAGWNRGRAVYLANCVACHSSDPSKEGPIGPAIKGSSKELLEARVLSTTYPPGYKPKRPTKVMPQFPFLEKEIAYLAEYLR